MRRADIVLLTCLGLTLAFSGPASAKKVSTPLPPVQFLSVQAVPVEGNAAVCDVRFQWTEAPEAPKGGFELFSYDVPLSASPAPADWAALGYYSFTGTQGTVQLPNGSTYYFNIRAVYRKANGKADYVYTAFGPGTESGTWNC